MEHRIKQCQKYQISLDYGDNYGSAKAVPQAACR